jgi:hypothetical protein
MSINYRTPPLAHQSLRAFQDVNAPAIEDGSELRYCVLSKNPSTGSYDEFAYTDRATDAWTARRTLAELNKDRKFFLRSMRVYTVGPSSPEAREDRDLWRDAWKTGQDHLVPADQQAAYKAWAAKKTTNVYARFQTDRDAPRWN